MQLPTLFELTRLGYDLSLIEVPDMERSFVQSGCTPTIVH